MEKFVPVSPAVNRPMRGCAKQTSIRVEFDMFAAKTFVYFVVVLMVAGMFLEQSVPMAISP